ncbi:MAG: DUF72 domain-containing protein [Myxococcota bacterium]
MAALLLVANPRIFSSSRLALERQSSAISLAIVLDHALMGSDGKVPWGSGQLGLFETRAPSDPFAGVRRLAETIPAGVRFGTSSWTFPGWAGLVYHKRYANRPAFVRESLREYASHPLFGTVGIDRSFYNPIPVEDFALYASQLPDGFLCAMKVWSELTTRVFTHGPRAGTVNRAFLDPELFLTQVWSPIEAAFVDHLGPLIVEVPPAKGSVNAAGFAARVDRFLRAMPPALFAFELRDPRLLSGDYVSVLRSHGAAHVYNLWRGMPDLVAQRAKTGPLWAPLVLRLMMPINTKYTQLKEAFAPFDRLRAPQPEMRAQVVELIHEAVRVAQPAFVLVNNKAEGCSPLTVQALVRML